MLLSLYDASGNCLLSTQLRCARDGLFVSTFDELRIEPQDLLLVWRCAGGQGRGSYSNPNAGLFPHTPPARPLLDELLKQPHILELFQPLPVGMPQFRMTAD